MNTKPENITRGNYDWSEADHETFLRMIYNDDYLALAKFHATIASELMQNAHWVQGSVQTITNPALTEAMIHAQLSTTFATMMERNKND